MKKYTKHIIITVVILLSILLAYLLTQMELHYWYLSKDGFGLLVSIGSYIIRLGQTP